MDDEDKRLNVAWSLDLGYVKVAREVRRICEDAAYTFQEMGIEIEEASPDIGIPEDMYSVIINAELVALLDTLRPLKEIKEK